jgi:exodeoxyribonuclease V gamma subunit
MLKTIHGNRTETLMEALLSDLARPLADPFSAEVILVQNPGMARWLGQQIAMDAGIAANLEFPLPASFVWRIQQAWLGESQETGAFDKDSLRWQVFDLLDGLLAQAAFAPLQCYLHDDPQQVRRYQLSDRIADLFDQYLIYRADMLLAWESGQLPEDGDALWQAYLWRAIVQRTQGGHRAGRLQRVLANAGQAPQGEIPRRVSVFGLTALAPVHLQLLALLAEHAEVTLYLLNPCREYWADLQDDKGQARKRALWRRNGATDVSALLDVGNPLLASMGQMGQVLVDQLLELEVDNQHVFDEPSPQSLLQHLQADILELRDRRCASAGERPWLDGADHSLQIHACHSPLREVQILQDQLQRCFDELPQLAPRDILIMAPDISVYAPWIEAVFGTAEGKRQIPWSIADLGGASAPLMQAVNELLRLPDSRLQATRVLSLLEVPALAARFGIDAAGLERLRLWVRESAIRWGSDAGMREDLGLPANGANTWAAGLERLFCGYAMPAGSDMIDGVLPLDDVEGSEADWLGGLAELLRQLSAWRQELARPVDADGWMQRINRLLAGFFRPALEEETLLQGVRSAMAALQSRCAQMGFSQALSLPLIRAELTQALSAAEGSRHFIAGGLTFCNMVPMRSIPFRVIALLGMNDADYPRQADRIPFDLMAAAPRPADRSRRHDDRYLFLEALLCARERFHISYVGNSQRNNSRKNPSVLVSELLDYVKQSWRLQEQGNDPAEPLLVRHPLQPFSPRYFDGADPRLFSYDDHWLRAASTLKAASPGFIDGQLKDEILEVDVQSLIAFLLNPAAWFLRHRLGLRLPTGEDVLEDEEPFKLTGYLSARLSAEALQGRLQGQDPTTERERMIASGELPHGRVGALLLEDIMASTEAMAERVTRRLNRGRDSLEVDLHLGGCHLTGWLQGVTASGLLAYRGWELKDKDRMRLWVGHLLLSLLRSQDHDDGAEVFSEHVALGHTLQLAPVQHPQQHLETLLQAWRAGQHQPLPFFLGASLAYVTNRQKDPATALDKAASTWENGYEDGLKNASIAMAFRGHSPLDDPAFVDWALRIAEPLHAASKTLTAARDKP